MSNLVDLPSRDPLQAAVDNMARVLPAMIEHVEMLAKLRRRAYLALVREGFTKEQALDLCWR
jgi:hypothetical protein